MSRSKERVVIKGPWIQFQFFKQGRYGEAWVNHTLSSDDREAIVFPGEDRQKRTRGYTKLCYSFGNKYNPLGCGSCLNLKTCIVEKGVSRETNYCQWERNRYVQRIPRLLSIDGSAILSASAIRRMGGGPVEESRAPAAAGPVENGGTLSTWTADIFNQGKNL